MKNARPTGDKGFTLLELLVTITLVAMVVVILSLALKLAIAAWERGQRQGDRPLIGITIPRLLEKQLKSIVRNLGIRTKLGSARLGFCGKKNGFSFYSCYAPMGSALQGVVRMTYVYDPEKKELFLYEQPVTRPEDLKEELNPLSETWNDELEPISEIRGIARLDVMYGSKVPIDPEDEDQWKEQWPCESKVLPRALRLSIDADEESAGGELVWYFSVGR